MSLLPSRGPDASGSQDGELQVVGVDEDVSAILDALSSDTAREILNAVYDEPGAPSDLADRLDMSIQKVSYHLEKLEDEELIAVAGTQYSEKGQEMTVYEPPEDPLVLFVGTQERKRSLRSLVRRLLPAVGILAAASLVVQFLLGELPFGPGDAVTEDSAASGGGAGAAPEPTPTPTPEPDGGGMEVAETTGTPTPQPEATGTPTPQPEATGTPTPQPEATTTPTEVAMETAQDLSTTVQESGGAAAGFDVAPGLAFFLGGLFVIGVFAAVWAYGEYA